MTHLVVAVDDSGPGRAALTWAEEYLRGLPEPVTAEVLTIWAPKESIGVEGFGLIDNTGYPEEAEKLLTDLLDEIGNPETFRAAVGSGRAVDSIVLAAHGCDLLVIGTRSAGPVRQALVGSMSQAIVGRATCPVAVIPEMYPDLGGRSLVAWDGAPGAIAALKWALEHRSREKIDVMFVAGSGDEESHALWVRDDISEIFGHDVADDLNVVIRFGSPNEQLADSNGEVAEIVMGDRACFGPGGSIWGSVTSQVLSTTRRPVVVVPVKDLGL